MASLNYKSGNEWKKVSGGKTGVLTFKGRAGVVTPKEGDYTAEMVGARPNTWMPNIAEVGGVNPNLLDNWYFGNPVDQRGGYVVPPETDYYALSDTEWNYAGTTSQYYAVKKKDDSAWILEVDGEKFMVPSSMVVRGYVSAEYTIDRWKITMGTLTLQDGAIFLTNGNLATLIENGSVFFGKTVTFSLLTKSGLISGTANLEDSYNVWDATNFVLGVAFQYRANNTFALLIAKDMFLSGAIAAKLELGSTQTLAHQDADGNWVLNEIPDYGEELRKCKRYFERGIVGMVDPLSFNSAFMPSHSFEVEKRATPNVRIFGEAFGETLTENKLTDANANSVSQTVVQVAADKYHIGFIKMSEALPAGNAYNYVYEASADL